MNPDLPSPSILWFRRDLRLKDNRALLAAIENNGPVICLYIREEGDEHAGALGGAQAWWLHHSLTALDRDLRAAGNALVLLSGDPLTVIRNIIAEHGATSVFWNRRHDPDGIAADTKIKAALKDDGIMARSFSGELLHDPTKVFNQSGTPFKVYTPFWRAVEAAGDPAFPWAAPETIPALDQGVKSEDLADWDLLPTKPDWAKRFGELWTPGEAGAASRLESFVDEALQGYKEKRDFPGGNFTSMLSPHLALGEISPARIWHATIGLPETIPGPDITHFRKELVWRDFSWNLLFHNNDLAVTNLNRRFDAFPWNDDHEALAAWQKGMTGYPIVDAGMRQLWQHGWMHNRVRMVVASFLIKDLMIDWRHGETWFRDTLVDADRASNAASWQWVAGSGADAAPFFRIFNPITQGEKFDPDGDYIRTYVPELANLPNEWIHKPFSAPDVVLIRAGVKLGQTYPRTIITHAMARDRALAAFQSLKEAS